VSGARKPAGDLRAEPGGRSGDENNHGASMPQRRGARENALGTV